MKKKANMNLKNSFFYKLIIYFICMIIIPVFCFWWCYEKILNYHYKENVLATQQINMENSFSLLESSLNNASNALVAFGGNQELVYYLDYRSAKSNMPYGAFMRIKTFCGELYTMTPYLNSLKVYSDSPLAIYARPIVRLAQFQPGEEIQRALIYAKPDEIIWQIVPSDTEEFPAIYGYKKLYTESYLKCIGYMEIQLSSQLLSDYFELLSGLMGDASFNFSLYQGNQRIYSTSPEVIDSVSVERRKSGYEMTFFQNQYKNYLEFPKLDLYIVCYGSMSDVNMSFSKNMPSLFISVILILLLGLFFLFFMSVMSLSKRIMAFSKFIKDSNPSHLLLYQPKRKKQQGADEVDVMIDTYNSLIQDNNTLISKIEKMELFTQAARYQALQQQIHPHFIYGTLETIRMTALMNKDKEAASMIFSLSTLLRYSMSISTKSVALRDEVEIAEHYLTIQKVRFDDRINYTFHVDKKLLEMEMPSFILQPILENAIVYGVSQTQEECTLIVEAYEDETCIVLSVSNTGLPITQQRLLEVNELLSGKVSAEEFKGRRNGMALNNIKERLAIFFNGRASIRLDLREGYTATVITIEKENGE